MGCVVTSTQGDGHSPGGSARYQDVNGRTVNTAEFGAGAWQITSSRYNKSGDVVWDLSAENRNHALNPTSATDPYVSGRNTSAERAELLASTTVYGRSREVQSTLGATHRMGLDSNT